MIVIMCGDRNWTNAEVIRFVLSLCPAGTVVIEGEARGADTLARIAAEQLQVQVLKGNGHDGNSFPHPAF